MAKLSINLLPVEVIASTKTQAKFAYINQLCIFLIIALILLTAGLLSIRLIQGRKLSQTKNDFTQIAQQVESLSSQESLLSTVKNRLQAITTLMNQESKQIKMFNLILGLKPSNVNLTYLSFDKSGNTLFSGESSTSAQLDQLFNNLMSPDTNQNSIKSVTAESVSRGITEQYKFDLTIQDK